MAKTTGDRAKEEADARKARGWFRDLEVTVFGTGEYKESTGKLLKMRHEHRENRVELADKNHKKDRIRKCGTVWSDIQSVEFIGVCGHEKMARDEISEMLEMLMRQTPDIFSRYDEPKPFAFDHADVSAASLGAFKTGKGWEDVLKQRDQFTSPDCNSFDKD